MLILKSKTDQIQVLRRILKANAQTSKPNVKAKSNAKAPGLRAMHAVNAKAAFSI